MSKSLRGVKVPINSRRVELLITCSGSATVSSHLDGESEPADKAEKARPFKWSEKAQAAVPFPEWSSALALHRLTLQHTLHLSCTTGQVTVASSRLREISFTHTMTRLASSPNLPSLEELELNLQCTNSSRRPWHLSIETCLSVCCLHYESKKKITLLRIGSASSCCYWSRQVEQSRPFTP